MNSPNILTPAPDISEAIESSKALLHDGKPEAACAVLRDALREFPQHEEALYVFAVCLRYSGKHEGAAATLKKLQKLRPSYGRAWQEEGHLLASMGDTAGAKTAYRKAVARNNSLLASWQALEQICIDDGDRALFAEAADNRFKLQALPAELLAVRNMMSEGRRHLAEQVCREFLKKNRTHVEGMRLLADLGVKSGVLDDAEFILESAVEFEPHNTFARFDYMTVLYRRQKYAQSLQQAKILHENDPDNPDYKVAYANQLVAVGEFDEALAIYSELADKADKNPGFHLVHGHALKTVGDVDNAIHSYRRSYTAKPDFGDAYWSLANLKTYRFTENEVDAMAAAEQAPGTGLEDRVHLCFALGKHLEDNESFEASARYYVRGNDLKRDELNYSSADMTAQLRAQRSVCNASLFESKDGHAAPDPIFIVGLPRAGSTLLEQILASHSQVDGTLELPNIPALAHKLDGRRSRGDDRRYPAILPELSAEQCREFGEAFIADTMVHRSGAPFFIDKMPNNFRHIGLIQLILPNAKIIDARRHPMACCFSGFKQLFATGQEFTYGLSEIGAYYRDYVDVMDHWDEVLPGKVLRVQYEDVVADIDTQLRRILDHCELPFEEACLNFHKTERSVRTPSSEQVRQPIYTSGLEQWRHFEPWLDPLKESLGPVLARYPIEN